MEPVLGEQKKTIRDNHNEMLISLQQAKTGYQLNIRFRLLMMAWDSDTNFQFKKT